MKNNINSFKKEEIKLFMKKYEEYTFEDNELEIKLQDKSGSFYMMEKYKIMLNKEFLFDDISRPIILYLCLYEKLQ